jgi:tripartite-type tricarboxylate transporter receptor subunit TctC
MRDQPQTVVEGGRMRLLLAVSIMLSSAMSLVAHGADADYPNRPIRLVVPYPPGAGTDATARIVA